MISATVLKDSTNWLGSRLTTLVLTYPRYIHSEFMTHRVFSKNSASSRAIPISKMIQEIQDNTVYPMWTKKAKGMQGEIITDEKIINELDADWYFIRDWLIGEVIYLDTKGVHKQNANRLLESFQYIKVICTGTDWDNFFELRDHKDAMPEIQELAKAIKEVFKNSIPEYLEPHQWHIPFGDKIHLIEEDDPEEEALKRIQIAVARCARISYNTFDEKMDYQKDFDLYERLVYANPKHLSPTEHIARVPTEDELEHFNCGYEIEDLSKPDLNRKVIFKKGKYISNLNGWIQYRKLIENETH